MRVTLQSGIFQSNLSTLGLLVILFSTNVDITHPSESNRSFELVMYG